MTSSLFSTEPDQILESVCSCVYMENIKVSDNPAVEGGNLRLSEKLPRLRAIDGVDVKTQREQGTPLKPSNGFMAMCLHQIQMLRDVTHRFQQDLKLVCTGL